MSFKIGITADALDEAGNPAFGDIGLDVFGGQSDISVEYVRELRREATPEQLQRYDGMLWLVPRLTAASLRGVERLVGIARLGVGYDMLDLDACTEADIAITITAGAVNRPVAEGILTFMLALGHKLMLKDRLVRTGGWQEKVHHNGSELRDRTIGVVGFGGIGGELCRLLQAFGIARFLTYDPYVSRERLAEAGAIGVDLATLMAESDYVSINCPLNGETRGLIGARELALMRPTAFLVNTARGGIVDEAALLDVLRGGRIAGAALDVFAHEPPLPDDPLLQLDNIILTPHAIAWTDELFRDMGRAACSGLLALSRGDVPAHVVNRDVLARPGFQRKLAALRDRRAGAT